MADDQFGALLSSIGFPAAQAASKIDRVQNTLTQDEGILKTHGEDERRNILADEESRGVLQSGERNMAIARQQGNEAQTTGALENTAANQVGDINDSIQQAIAAQQANAADLAAQHSLVAQQTAAQQAIYQQDANNRLAFYHAIYGAGGDPGYLYANQYSG